MLHSLCYTSLCYNSLCYTSLCYNSLYYSSLCYNSLCYNSLCYNSLCYNSLCYTSLCYNSLCYNSLCYNSLCYNSLCYNSLCYTLCAIPLCATTLCAITLCATTLCAIPLCATTLCAIPLCATLSVLYLSVLQLSVWLRDVLDDLCHHKLRDVTDFEWQRFLRPSLEAGEGRLTLKCLNSCLHYGYEYLGCQATPVFTPRANNYIVAFTQVRATQPIHSPVRVPGYEAGTYDVMVCDSDSSGIVGTPRQRNGGTTCC